MWPEPVPPEFSTYSRSDGLPPGPQPDLLRYEPSSLATDPLEAITGLELMLGLMGWLTLLVWQFLRQVVGGRHEDRLL